MRETGSGTLDFSYRIVNDVSSGGSLDFVTRNSFPGFGTDVDFRTDGCGDHRPRPGQPQRRRRRGSDRFFQHQSPVSGSGVVLLLRQDGRDGVRRERHGITCLQQQSWRWTFDFETFQPVIKPGTLKATSIEIASSTRPITSSGARVREIPTPRLTTTCGGQTSGGGSSATARCRPAIACARRRCKRCRRRARAGVARFACDWRRGDDAQPAALTKFRVSNR